MYGKTHKIIVPKLGPGAVARIRSPHFANPQDAARLRKRVITLPQTDVQPEKRRG